MEKPIDNSVQERVARLLGGREVILTSETERGEVRIGNVYSETQGNDRTRFGVVAFTKEGVVLEKLDGVNKGKLLLGTITGLSDMEKE